MGHKASTGTRVISPSARPAGDPTPCVSRLHHWPPRAFSLQSKETVMSDETPTGPDLTRGVPVEAIGDGAMLSGHVGAEAGLIARIDGQLPAIGAACTHYHGPLAEGLIVGGAVRCPWHHACFDLKTGEAVGAPAIDPVA